MQTDLEEAKTQEIAKLQETLHDLQLQVEEAKTMATKEREAARKAIEEAPPVIKETPVLVEDTEKVNSLTAEVDQLKVWCQLNYFYTSHAVVLFYRVLGLLVLNNYGESVHVKHTVYFYPNVLETWSSYVTTFFIDNIDM